MIENTPHVEPEAPRQSLIQKLRTLLTPRELRIEDSALRTPLSDDQVAELKITIEAKPDGIDTTAIIHESYQRLVSLLGPHQREGVTHDTVSNRIIVTDPDSLFALPYFLKLPGENSDKFWNYPLKRARRTLGATEAMYLKMTRAASFTYLGIVVIPNTSLPLSERDVKDQEYMREQSIQPEDFALLELKMMIAHELTHFLYGQQRYVLSFLNEPLTDYIATRVYPEIIGTDVRFKWAIAAIEEYISILGFTDISDFFQRATKNSQFDTVALDAAIEIHKKYFSKVSYPLYSLPEETLNEKGLSKYYPLPKRENNG